MRVSQIYTGKDTVMEMLYGLSGLEGNVDINIHTYIHDFTNILGISPFYFSLSRAGVFKKEE